MALVVAYYFSAYCIPFEVDNLKFFAVLLINQFYVLKFVGFFKFVK